MVMNSIEIDARYIFRHYGSNRAPMNLGFDAAWLEVNKGFARELEKWIRDTLADHSDVYFVTQIQVIYFFDQTSPPNIQNVDISMEYLSTFKIMKMFSSS